MIVKERTARGSTVRVTFQVPASIWAGSIHLVGDFNAWSPESHPLVQNEENWEATLELPVGQDYEFRYLIDGERWCNDCKADAYVANAIGGHNSVVQL